MAFYETYTLEEALKIPMEEVESIRLKYLNLNQIPVEVFKFKNLKEFNFQGNNLKKIPLEIFELTSLTYLNLSDNQISEIPKNIQFSIQLELLYVDRNPLEKLPNFPLSLKVLSLDETCQKEIGSNIYELHQLEKLNLANNLTHENPQKHLFNNITNISPKIKNLKHLQTLNLSFNENLHKNIDDIFTYLSDLKELDILLLNGIGLKSFPTIVLNNLRCLHIEQNKLNHFPTILLKMPKLESLNIALNELSLSELQKTLLLEQEIYSLDIWGNEYRTHYKEHHIEEGQYEKLVIALTKKFSEFTSIKAYNRDY